jgi:hypothetical protein
MDVLDRSEWDCPDDYGRLRIGTSTGNPDAKLADAVKLLLDRRRNQTHRPPQHRGLKAGGPLVFRVHNEPGAQDTSLSATHTFCPP